MPIEVHCPNPSCARVHLVKNRYAGMRGRCPACKSWMYVPKSGFLPSMATPRPEGLEEMAAWQETPPLRTRGASGKAAVLDESESTRSSTRTPPMEEPLAVQELDEASQPPKPRFSRLAALLLFLGILALGAVAAAPYLEKHSRTLTDGSRRLYGIADEHALSVSAAPGGVAVVVLLALLAGLLAGRFTAVCAFLLYLALGGAAAILFLATHAFRGETLEVVRGSLPGSLQQAHVAVGGAAGACLLLLLAAVVLHRRWWSRILGFLLLVTLIVLGPAWVYRSELGIEDLVPPQVEELLAPALDAAGSLTR